MLDLVGRFPNKVIRNALPEIVPSAVAGVLLELVKIAPDTACHSLPRESRIALARLLKHMPATVKGLLGLTKAVVASGGVSLKEVDFRTMRSNKIANLYIVGDLLDVYRPSGGYSLQLCWTTAAIAGESAAAAIK
jgi:predicted flavoprotein YhiN